MVSQFIGSYNEIANNKEGGTMQVKVKIDENCKEPKVLIITDKMTDEISTLVKNLSASYPNVIAGFLDKRVELLEQNVIVRIYAANQKVYAQTADSEYTLQLRLYELEERLDKSFFVPISNSEIVNLKNVVRLDLSISGMICIELSNHVISYVSRRYAAKIKGTLGI